MPRDGRGGEQVCGGDGRRYRWARCGPQTCIGGIKGLGPGGTAVLPMPFWWQGQGLGSHSLRVIASGGALVRELALDRAVLASPRLTTVLALVLGAASCLEVPIAPTLDPQPPGLAPTR